MGSAQVDDVIGIRSGPNLSRARNALVSAFLQSCAADWLLMADSDMVFAPDALDRLIAAADPAERPLVGALCFSVNDEQPGGDPFPTLYGLAETDGRVTFARWREWPEGECVRAGATGAAFLLAHRTALARIGTENDGPAPWFCELTAGGVLLGEDLAFCLRARRAAIPVHVHTGVQAGHMKDAMLGKVR